MVIFVPNHEALPCKEVLHLNQALTHVCRYCDYMMHLISLVQPGAQTGLTGAHGSFFAPWWVDPALLFSLIIGPLVT